MPFLDFGLELPPPWEGFFEGMVFVLGATALFLIVLVKNCLEDETCQAAVVEGQATLEVVQDSMSETERSERLGARKKKDVQRKKKGPPGKSTDKGVLNPSEPGGSSMSNLKEGASLYPMKELEALNLDSSESSENETSENETLDPDEEAELDEEAALKYQGSEQESSLFQRTESLQHNNEPKVKGELPNCIVMDFYLLLALWVVLNAVVWSIAFCLCLCDQPTQEKQVAKVHIKMGTSQSHPIFLALQELFEQKLKMKKGTIERFLNECDTIAPWFAVSGNLTVASWEKLGKDLDFAWEQGTLKPGVWPVWHLVRSCLEDQKCCQAAIEKGQAALEMLQEERSEKQGSTKETDSEKIDTGEETDGTDTESELQELIDQMRKQSLKTRHKRRKKESEMAKELFPSAPPPYNPAEGGTRPPRSTFCPEVWWAVRTEQLLNLKSCWRCLKIALLLLICFLIPYMWLMQ